MITSKSVYTENLHPYEAGLEIGSSLKAIIPEIVIIFTSIHFDRDNGFSDFFDGIYDGLDSSNVLIVGATGDGFYETQKVNSFGASAIGINSFGKIKFNASFVQGISSDSYSKAKETAEKIIKIDNKVKLGFVLSNFKADGEAIARGVSEVLKVPFVGMFAGDDRKFKKSYVFHNRLVFDDALVILSLSGSFSFITNTSSGWTPVGKAGVVTEAKDNIITKIDNKDSLSFIQEQLGKPPTDIDLGTIPLAIQINKNKNEFLLRAPMKWNRADHNVYYFSSVEKGSEVRVCLSTCDQVLKGVEDNIKKISNINFLPKAAIIISCAGRKWILGDRISNEVTKFLSVLGVRVPLIGVPSYGEIGPFRNVDGTYSDTYFHNVSYVVLILGE